jgi:hypothetical protein
MGATGGSVSVICRCSESANGQITRDFTSSETQKSERLQCEWTETKCNKDDAARMGCKVLANKIDFMFG